VAVFTIEHTARKPHKCSTCGGAIRPGERYSCVSLTPDHDDVGNDGWWRLAYHLTDVECDYEFAAPRKDEQR
jgi:hypothetical protein